MLAYCRREAITFTRGRAHKSKDQRHGEQKNGTIVRQLVGYDRYEGQPAYRVASGTIREQRKADGGTRTLDPWFTKPLLYQLSYVGADPQPAPRGKG